MPDLEALSRDPLLSRSPLGPLRVRRLGRDVVVERLSRLEGRPGTFIHTMDYRGPLAAIYGRRFWESRGVQELYARKEREQAAAAERHDEALSRDTQAAVAWWARWCERRGEDAVALLAGAR